MIIRNDLKIIISYRKRQLIADVTYDRDQKLAENVEVKRQSLYVLPAIKHQQTQLEKLCR